MGTIQLDSQMPQRFGLVYTGADNREHMPYVIHRALLGSLERFMGILIEHYAARSRPGSPRCRHSSSRSPRPHRIAAADVADDLSARNVRVEVDMSDETLGKRIRNAELARVPYVVVLGDKEVGGDTLSLRIRGEREVVVRGAKPPRWTRSSKLLRCDPASRSDQFLTSGALGLSEVQPKTARMVGCCSQPFVVSRREYA